MQKIYLSLLLLCSITTASAQLPNPHFGNFEKTPCPFNQADTVFWPERWQLYQTTDGHWDGPIDSTQCITGLPINNGYGLSINLEHVNLSRPLFIRAQIDSLPLAPTLAPDQLYSNIISAFVNPAAVPVLSGSDCPDNLCSGALIGIAIPDTQGMPGAATRFQTGLLSLYSPNPTVCYVNGESCFPSERFDEQYIREYILKFTFDSTAHLMNAFLSINSTAIFPAFDLDYGAGYVVSVPASTNPVNVEEVAGFVQWTPNYLGLYTAPSYPSPQNLSYIEAYPVPNSATPQDISLTVDSWQTLEMQPFAQFRGGLVAGSDSIRHQFTLLNNGGAICLNFVDLIFDGGDAYQHAGGNLDFNNSYACMQFKNGSTLRVNDGATLHYGQDGAGMLVICASSSIALEQNATLIIDGILQISECNDALPPSEIFMDLPPGATLVFTENAWLTNRYSKDQQMQLNVRMLGGSLDDSALDPASQALICRVYPEPAARLADNVQLGPNPFTRGQLNLRYLAGTEEALQLRWYSLDGRFVREEFFAAVKGWNNWAPESPARAGFYFVEIQTPRGRVIQRMICLDN